MNTRSASTPQESNRILRGRQVTLVVLILFALLPLPALIWAPVQAPPRLRVGSLVGGLVADLPIVTLLVVALFKMPVVRRAYWFLPLYFGLRGVGGAVSLFLNVWLGVGPVGFAFQSALLRLFPEAIFGAALYVFRPRGAIEDVAT